jgi:hypothetical protein
MPKREDLLAKARNNPAGLRFTELCLLAAKYGWVKARTKGSHHMYKHPSEKSLMDFQEAPDGKGKKYQVEQLLDAIDRLLLKEG